jgi:cobalamin synthase
VGLGWVSGDCFGASIEVVESVLLGGLVVATSGQLEIWA